MTLQSRPRLARMSSAVACQLRAHCLILSKNAPFDFSTDGACACPWQQLVGEPGKELLGPGKPRKRSILYPLTERHGPARPASLMEGRGPAWSPVRRLGSQDRRRMKARRKPCPRIAKAHIWGRSPPCSGLPPGGLRATAGRREEPAGSPVRHRDRIRRRSSYAGRPRSRAAPARQRCC